jgi:hypothetical protein
VRGTYRVGEVVERFSCGAGPAGWRYTSTTDVGDTLDLTVDDDGRVRRLVAVLDGWEVRAGSVGDQVLWVRGDQEHRARADGLTGSSPAYEVALARGLRLEVGAARDLVLVEITEPVGAARTVRQRWARERGPEPDVDRWVVSDLDTGQRWVLHVSGEVLVSREGRAAAWLSELLP